MRRRDFIRVIAGTAAAWPLLAHAQQTVPVIGFIGAESPERYTERLNAFREGLKETGFVEGQNVSIEYRWGGTRIQSLPRIGSAVGQATGDRNCRYWW